MGGQKHNNIFKEEESGEVGPGAPRGRQMIIGWEGIRGDL